MIMLTALAGPHVLQIARFVKSVRGVEEGVMTSCNAEKLAAKGKQLIRHLKNFQKKIALDFEFCITQ